MRIVSMLGAVAVTFAGGVASASTWELDASHSQVGFGVKHLMVSTTKGNFKKFSGTLTLDDKDVTKSNVVVDIDTASVDTDEPKRDEHLRSPDFFQSDKFPKMSFKSTKVEKQGEALLVTGDLTIRGVTKPVVLKVEGFGPEVKDPWGNTRRGAVATTQIKRSDFGLTWNKSLETGGVVVGDEVAINIECELIKKK
ncbi:MAG: YceI family protein [Myxococcota bacterium]